MCTGQIGAVLGRQRGMWNGFATGKRDNHGAVRCTALHNGHTDQSREQHQDDYLELRGRRRGHHGGLRKTGRRRWHFVGRRLRHGQWCSHAHAA